MNAEGRPEAALEVVGDDTHSIPRRGRGHTLLDAAVDYATAGWRVLPCWPSGTRAKQPLVAHGLHDASGDLGVITRWWRRWPRAVIGAAVPDALLVLDIDPRHDGSTEALEAALGPLPETLTCWSGRDDGGRHLYFLRPPGALTARRLPSGVDLRVKNYCIVPPSPHPATGRPYRWEMREPAALPAAATRALRLPPEPRRRRPSWPAAHDGNGLIRFVAAATEGNRNAVLFWAAGRAVMDGLDLADDLVTAAMAAGLGEVEARRTVASARRRRSA